MLTPLTIKKEDLSPYLESSVNAKLFILEENREEPYGPINLKNSYSGFFNRILKYYTNASYNVQFAVSSNYLRFSTKKRVLDMVSFVKNRQNMDLFLIFDKIGLSVVTIQAAYDESSRTLYLNNYLLKKIKSLDESMQTQLAMYLISLIVFYSRLAKFVDNDGTIPLLNANNNIKESQSIIDAEDIYGSKEDIDYVISFIKTFDDDFICNLDELSLDDLDTVKAYKHFVLSPTKTNQATYPTINQYALLKQEDKLFILFRRQNTYSYLLDLTEHKMYANTSFSILDYQPESFINQISLVFNLDKPSIIFTNKLDEFITNAELPFKLVNFEDYDNVQERMDEMAARINIEPIVNFDEVKKLFGEKLILESGTSYVVSMKEQYENDPYAVQLLNNVSDSIKVIDLPKDLQIKVNAYAKGIIYSSFFAGDSGTGKTTLAKVIGYKLGLPTLSINFSSNIEESDVIGTWISNPNKQSPNDPEFVWKDGLLTKAIRNGYLIILEEINFARPGILGKLNSLLDETRQIDLPTGEIVKAHSNFRLIVTGNIGYEGTNLLNLAFVNRYDYIREFSQMTPEEIENIIKTKTGYKDNTKISTIMQVYLAVKKYSNENKLNLIVSVRQLINLFKQAKFHATAYDAVIATIVNTAFLQEQEHREHFINSVLPAFSLKFKL